VAALAPEAVVQRRPHYRREGAEVRFLISRRPTLTLADDEMALFDAVAAPTAVASLPPRALAALAAWHEAEVIDVIPPLAPQGRPLVAIEPHMDDVVLSAGGRLLLHRGKRPVVLLSVTRDSNVSGSWSLQREFFDDAAVTALRVAESDRVVELAGGGEHRSLGIPDAPLRFRPAHEWHPYVQHDQRRQRCLSAPRSCKVFQRALPAGKILVVPVREIAFSQGAFQQKSFVRIVVNVH